MLANPKRAHSVATFALLAALGVLAAPATLAADAPAPTNFTRTLTYLRLYTTPDGVSHFADEAISLAPSGADPAAALATSRLGDVKGATFVSLKAGTIEDWHTTSRRQLLICLRGPVELTASDGEKRLISPGQMLLVEDLIGKGHITRVLGTEDHVALAVQVPDGVLVSTTKGK
jgi:quercetin dioxygenase-like cupin family protein